MSDMKIISSGGTDSGKKRSNNEDAFLIDDRIGLYVVADGIGGSEGGEVASRVAVDELAKAVAVLVRDAGDSSYETGSENLLQQAVPIANNEILQVQAERPELSAMGTTLTTLLLKDKNAFLAHIGDSRAYLLRSGEFRQLTTDHSLVGEQVRQGVITPEQARTSPYRHVITRALGINEEARTDFAKHPLQRGDCFLLCTDGLTEMVEDAEIAGMLSALPPREAVQKLLAAANDRGGVDNITAVVVVIAEI